MLDHFHLPTPNGAAEVFYYEGQSTGSCQMWQKPRGKSMVHILLVGPGGNGGVGTAGTGGSGAVGGGGGGSGGQTTLLMPAHFLPDVLFLFLNDASVSSPSRVSIAPNTTANNIIAHAVNGGFGSAATGGSGAAAATAANMPLGWNFRQQVLAGQNGVTAIGNGTASALALPTTGLLVTGGTAGGSAGAAGADCAAGTAITGAGVFPTQAGGATSTVSTVVPFAGLGGCRPIPGLMFGYGGTGGASSHGSATGAGLAGGAGGAGAPGCGGGGGGGCITGGVSGALGRGGPSFCLITCW